MTSFANIECPSQTQKGLSFKKLEAQNTIKVMSEPSKHMCCFPNLEKPVPRYLFTVYDYDDKTVKYLSVGKSLVDKMYQEIQFADKKETVWSAIKALFRRIFRGKKVECPVFKISKNMPSKNSQYNNYDVRLIAWDKK